MRPEAVTIDEVGPPVASELTATEGRELLLAYGRKPQRLGVTHDLDTGKVTLEGRGYAGVIALGNGRVVRIRTKVPAQSIFYLIGFTDGTYTFFDREIRYETSTDFWEVLVGEYARRVADLLRYGLHQGYVLTQDDKLLALRGRLLVGRQIHSNSVRRERLACRYEEFTSDLPMNRALKLATFLATRFSYHDQQIRKQLGRNLQLFGGVSLTQMEPWVPRQVLLDRLSGRYRIPLFLASLIIGSVTLEDRPGKEPFCSYLVDMATLFERFVVAMLRRELAGTDLRVVAQEERPMDVAGKLRFVSDITIWRGPHCVAVLDTKYKRYAKVNGGRGAPEEDDARQVMVYGQLLSADRVVLVYPEAVAERLPMRGGFRTVDIVGFELAGSPDQLAARARAFVQQLLHDVLEPAAA